MIEKHEPTRRERILEAAFETVGRYGYKRTSMDDIATAVGISRPALYQEFKSKADIYRAFMQRYCDDTLAGIETALAENAPMQERLREAFNLSIVTPHRMVEQMPHGSEFLGLKNEIAQDLMDSWSLQFGVLLEQTFAKEHGLSKESASQLAATVMNVVTGVKSRGLTADEAANELEKLLGVVGLVAT